MLDWTLFTIIALLVVEVGVLLWLYKNVLSRWNADRWEEKVSQDEGIWLVNILEPVIEEVVVRILDVAPKELTKVLKGELLASQGSLSRAVMADSSSPEDMILGLSTSILQSLGYKKPNPIMAAKLAGVLGNVAVKLNGPETKPVIASLPVGADVFRP